MNSRLSILLVGAGLVSFVGCAGGPVGKSYHVTAYKPHNPANVRVKLSTSTQNVYVMEGDRLLMAAKTNVGKASSPTPSGHFTIFNKDKTRRRQSEPDRGYPMAYWCEFAPAYGFHEGFVHPYPHTHGCVRMHKEAAARLFALVHIGTPVEVAHSLPEDAKYGAKVQPLDQSRDPDPPRSYLMSPAWFKDPAGPLLIEG
jgi:L,D-transpeptidase catalytic domain